VVYIKQQMPGPNKLGREEYFNLPVYLLNQIMEWYANITGKNSAHASDHKQQLHATAMLAVTD